MKILLGSLIYFNPADIYVYIPTPWSLSIKNADMKKGRKKNKGGNLAGKRRLSVIQRKEEKINNTKNDWKGIKET